MSQDSNPAPVEAPIAPLAVESQQAAVEAPAAAPASAPVVEPVVETPAAATPEPTTPPAEIAPVTMPQPTGQDYMAAFGRELGAVWFAEGKSFDDAKRQFTEKLTADLTAAKTKNAELVASLEALRGEKRPLGFTAEPAAAEKEKLDQEAARGKYANKLQPGVAQFAAGIVLPARK